jgi:hypothetical protein
MAKIVLDNIASGYNLNKINSNFDTIAAALNDEVLYRDNPVGEPNALQTDVDCNSKNLYNIGDLRVLGTATINGVNLDTVNSALVWRGIWDSGTTYAVSDAIYYSGSSYICITAHTNSTPPSTNWELLASQGASGAGTGDVVGPASSVNDRIVTFNGITGKLVKDSGTLLSGLVSVGANTTITSLSGLTTPLSAAQGGTGSIDGAVVLTGNQTIAGVKTFSSQPVLPQAMTLGTAIPTTSGTSHDITGIPSWVKKVTLLVNGTSLSGTSDVLVQLGDVGGIETSGYAGGLNPNAVFFSAGFRLSDAATAGQSIDCIMTLIRISGNAWVCSFNTGHPSVYLTRAGAGSKTLSDTLTQIRVTTVNGTDTFDAGSINILYE